MADGKKVDSVKTNAAKGWKYSFVNKPIIKTENDILVESFLLETHGYSVTTFLFETTYNSPLGVTI